ncbi:MAG: hypothetical protein COZ69_05670 [Deltaproteobacteria bacterium CG_4_8_14_3_um_filter_45_9]|nr:MAG: hypothetical protein COZ69_05670 [Deltaproteobacteria bacterium CG_4_8_14_3_um_filter_45_9]
MERLMMVDEVAQYLRLNREVVLRKARKGELPAVKLGTKTYRFYREQVDEWLRSKSTTEAEKLKGTLYPSGVKEDLTRGEVYEEERGKLVKEEIQRVLSENKDLLKGYGVKKIGLFGSYVRGQQREDSDIDVLVEVEGISLLDFVGLELKLSEILGRKVDLVSAKALKPHVKPYILEEVEYLEGL